MRIESSTRRIFHPRGFLYLSFGHSFARRVFSADSPTLGHAEAQMAQGDIPSTIESHDNFRIASRSESRLSCPGSVDYAMDEMSKRTLQQAQWCTQPPKPAYRRPHPTNPYGSPMEFQ